jgi:hypothetical protein
MATFTVPARLTKYTGKAASYPRQTVTADMDIVLEIDLDRLARDLGWKAWTNKSMKSRAMGGAIVVKFKNARPAS